MLPIISAFYGFDQKRTGGVAGLPQPPAPYGFRRYYFLLFGPGPDGSLK